MRNPKHMSNKLEFYSKKAFVLESKIITLIGVFLMFGSIGGYERCSLSIGKFIMYLVIGFVITVAGGLAVKFFGEFEDDDDDDKGGE